MLTTIAIVVVLLILVVLIVAATQPDVFRVERAISITAPPDQVFALINDFRRWDAWSPWDKKDPAMKRTYGATASGKGANYAWEGNKDIGKGSMEITDSVPPSRIQIKLEFLQPFEAHNIVSFTLEARGSATQVTWAMEGPVPYFAKIIHMFCNTDRMVGKDFEAGLASLKAVAEK